MEAERRRASAPKKIDHTSEKVYVFPRRSFRTVWPGDMRGIDELEVVGEAVSTGAEEEDEENGIGDAVSSMV